MRLCKRSKEMLKSVCANEPRRCIVDGIFGGGEPENRGLSPIIISGHNILLE